MNPPKSRRISARLYGKSISFRGLNRYFFDPTEVALDIPEDALLRAEKRWSFYPFKACLLPAQTVCYAEVKTNLMHSDVVHLCKVRQAKRPPRFLYAHEIREYEAQGIATFPLTAVPFRLLTDLVIEYKAPERGRLMDCRCYLSPLEGEAKSVNHAYSELARFFETKRRSSTGNVFLKVLAETPNGLLSLETLRRQTELRHIGYAGDPQPALL